MNVEAQKMGGGTQTGINLRKTSLMVMAIASLGGILYGYDLGIISGALLFMQGALALNSTEMSLIVAAVLGGGSLATLLGGPLADRIGRKATMLISGAVFIVGIVVTALATNFEMAMIGRLVQGVGVGLITIVVPLYIVEVIPAHLRGRSVTLFQLFLTFGILLGYLVGYAFNDAGAWRAMFFTALIPAVLFLVAGFTLPKSARWMFRRGRVDEAKRLLLKTHTPKEAESTMEELQTASGEEQEEEGRSWKLLLQPGYRKAFLIALAVGILTQLTGINTMLQFSSVILQDSGLDSSAAAILGSVAVGLTNFIITIVALSLIDRLGRRPLLIFGTAGAMLSFLFVGLVHAFSAPSAFLGYATLVGFIAFIIFYAIGPGVVVWLAISEVMPLAIRAKGMAIALFANSLTSAGLAAIFMDVVTVIGYGGAFLTLAFCILLYLLLAIFPLPETKGRNLEEIEQLFFSNKSK